MEGKIKELREMGVISIPRRELAKYLNIPEGDIPYYGLESDPEDGEQILIGEESND